MKSNFEKKFSKYAIENLSLYLIICYGIGYILQYMGGNILEYLTLEPIYILKGQVWRLVTWILIPPPSDNLFFTLIMLYFYYSVGSALERVWGAYRYNCYLFSGMLFTVLGTFILFFSFLLMGKTILLGDLVHTYYVNMSIFLAFAATFPEHEVLLMYVIPIKVKYLGILYGVYMILECIRGGIFVAVVIGTSLLNFIVFFLTSRGKIKKRMSGQTQRQNHFKKQVRHTARITRHKCAICGRTEETNPELEFRFCSKCNGNFEYCQDHLFTHKHIE